MTGAEIRIGTRGSALALAQARLVATALEQAGQKARLVIIETDGDRRAPDTAWGEGAFVAAIERALVGGAVDLAVHSAKDVPTDEDPRLRIGAFLPRADPRDALVVAVGAACRGLDDLASGSRVGTDSPRRTAFVRARRPDLAVHPLHGNVDTRLRRLEAGETDALVLACAGLDRLGLGGRIAERLAPEIVPPAPGQGALAVQVRGDDRRMVAATALIDHRPTRLAVEAERAFLAACGGGCRSPIGALATIDGDAIDLLGGSASADGGSIVLAHRRGPLTAGPELGLELTHALAWAIGRARAAMGARGPGVSVAGVSATGPPSKARRVLVTRAADQADELMTALRIAGLEPVAVPAIAVEFAAPGGELDRAAASLQRCSWAVVTSANGARAILAAATRTAARLDGPSWAAIGPATRRALEVGGVAVAHVATESRGLALAAELPIGSGDRVLVVRGDLAGDDIAVSLRARGAAVDDVIGYRIREAPAGSGDLLRAAVAGGSVTAIVFTSGSTVRGLVGLARNDGLDLASIPSICIGPATADAAREAGFAVLAVSATPQATDLAATIVRALAAHAQEVA